MAIIPLLFGKADPAAATTATALPPVPAPDTSDVSGYKFPVSVRIAGIILTCAAASGDTVKVQASDAGTAVGPAVTATNAAPQQEAFIGQFDQAVIPAGDTIGVLYTTTTGTTYTVNDVACIVLVDIPANVLGA